MFIGHYKDILYKGSLEEVFLYATSFIIPLGYIESVAVIILYDLGRSNELIWGVKIDEATKYLLCFSNLMLYAFITYIYKELRLWHTYEIHAEIIEMLSKRKCRISYELFRRHYEAIVINMNKRDKMTIYIDHNDDKIVWCNNGFIRSYHLSAFISSWYLLAFGIKVFLKACE